MSGFEDFLDPQSSALLGLAGGFAQAAMPSRLPISTGSALALGAQGYQQGGLGALAGQRQLAELRSAQLQNQLSAARLPLMQAQIASLTGGGMSGGGAPPPGGAFSGTPSSGMGAPAPPQTPAAGGLGGMVPGTPNPAPPSGPAGYAALTGGSGGGLMLSPQQLLLQARIASAEGNDRAAAALYSNFASMAGGAGYTFRADGTAEATPGGGADPMTLATRAAAEAGGKLPYEEAGKSYQANLDAGVHSANAAVDASYQPPVTINQRNADGSISQVQVPRTSLPLLGRQSGGATIPADTFANRVIGVENATGNPAETNGASSATGDGQFTQGTWLSTFRAVHPDLARGMSEDQILALRNDQGASRQLVNDYAQENAPVLQQAGLTPTAATLGAAHQLGPQGAIAVFKAPLDTPMSSVLPPDVIAANPQYARMSVGTYRSNAIMRYGAAPVSFGGSGSASSLPGAVVGKPDYTPQQAKVQDQLGDQQSDIIKNATTATNTQRDLTILRSAAQDFRTGASGPERGALLSHLVDGFQMAGMTPPKSWVDGSASAETIEKTGMDLAIQRTKSLGSREAGFVLQMIKKNLPSTALSTGGYDTVLNALDQASQRDRDLENFRQSWTQAHGGSWSGGQTAFDQSHPPESYASRVTPLPSPARPSSAIPNVIYRTPMGPMLWGGATGWLNADGSVPKQPAAVPAQQASAPPAAPIVPTGP